MFVGTPDKILLGPTLTTMPILYQNTKQNITIVYDTFISAVKIWLSPWRLLSAQVGKKSLYYHVEIHQRTKSSICNKYIEIEVKLKRDEILN